MRVQDARGDWWVDIEDAARMAFRSVRTIRRWIKAGILTPLMGMMRETDVWDAERDVRLGEHKTRIRDH